MKSAGQSTTCVPTIPDAMWSRGIVRKGAASHRVLTALFTRLCTHPLVANAFSWHRCVQSTYCTYLNQQRPRHQPLFLESLSRADRTSQDACVCVAEIVFGSPGSRDARGRGMAPGGPRETQHPTSSASSSKHPPGSWNPRPSSLI